MPNIFVAGRKADHLLEPTIAKLVAYGYKYYTHKSVNVYKHILLLIF